MTHRDSYISEIHRLTRPSQLRHILQPIKTLKTSHVPKPGQRRGTNDS